jgi:hypothetical protein
VIKNHQNNTNYYIVDPDKAKCILFTAPFIWALLFFVGGRESYPFFWEAVWEVEGPFFWEVELFYGRQSSFYGRWRAPPLFVGGRGPCPFS